MQYQSLLLVLATCAPLLEAFFVPTPAASPPQSRSGIGSSKHAFTRRQLVAAQSASQLRPRDFAPTELLKHNHVLHFINGKTTSADLYLYSLIHISEDIPAFSDPDRIPEDQAPFAAHVHVTSTLPTLLLEESDPHFARIACSASTIELSFYTDAALSLTWAELAKHDEILVITSHVGCNANGERNPFLCVSS